MNRSSRLARRRCVRCIAVAGATLTPAAASLAVTPTYNAGASFWHVTHNPGGPGGTTNQILNQALQNGTPTNTYQHTETFKLSPLGTTKAKAGVGRTQGSTVAKVLFPSGLGVDQIDPTPSTQSSSVVRVDFKSVWDVNGTFGPAITGVFSVPFGANVGSSGSALFECNVIWERIINGGAPTAARTPYSVSMPFGPGTHLTSFTAPSASFSPTTMLNTAGVDQLIVRGFVQFAVNNTDEPTYSSFPVLGTGPDEFIPQNPQEEEILRMEPLSGFDIPNPQPGLYWDVNGSAPGAGGPSPSGSWDGTTPNFSNDPAGGGPTMPATGPNDVVNFSAGSDATGPYAVNVNGTQTASEIIVEEGSVNLVGGGIVVEAFNVVTGANCNVASQVNAGPVLGGIVKNGGGTLTLTAANTYTGGTIVSEGTLRVTRLHQNNPVHITGGTLRVLESAPGLGSGHPSGNDAFVSRPASLVIDNDNAPLGTRVYYGTLDLTNNDLILDYSGPSPIAHIEDMVRSGYNFTGDWLGTGITSSIAALDGNYVIAIADNATLSAPFGTAQGGALFAGVDVDLDTILIKFTHRSDLDLDGHVTPNDAAIFGGNYSEGDFANWAVGDMDYDGIFTPTDAAIFGGFYDQSLASLPEPASFVLLSIGGTWILTRRRPHNK